MGRPGTGCGSLLLAWPQVRNAEAVWREHSEGIALLGARILVPGLPPIHCVTLGNLMPSLDLFS